MADSIYTFDPTAINNSSLDSIPYGPNQLYHNKIDDLFRAYAAKLAQFVDDLGAANTVAGTADAITVTLASGITAYATGQLFRFIAGSANTGAATMNVNAIGAKAIRKISGGTDVALSAGDIAAGETYLVIYRASANSAAGAWVLVGGAAIAAATTSAAGIVELATLAETLAPPVNSSLVPTISNLPFPTGHISPSLTIAKNGSDASNDIDVSAFTARDSTDSYNIVCAARTKQIDASWAVGTNAGGLDTGTVSNTTYYIWGIKRTDTGVCDVLFSLSASSPTMPTNYDAKVLIGSFARVGGVNQAPRTYATETTPWVSYTPTFTGFGTVSSIYVRSRRVGDNLEINGKFTTGTPTVAEARITLGFNGTNSNVTSDVAKVPSIMAAGDWLRNNPGVSGRYATLIESNVGYLTASISASVTYSGLTKVNGNDLCAAGEVHAFTAFVPISGW